MDTDAHLRALRRWQRLLDSAFRVPGTTVTLPLLMMLWFLTLIGRPLV